nr:NUDIX hydrolase [Roseospira visakhapatnamensis]
MILARTTDGRLAMVRQWRPARERMSLEIPAGAIDPGETPEQAARRELLEETGLGGGTWHALGVGGLAIDRDTMRLHVFLALDVHPTGRAPEPGLEVRLLDPPAVRAALTSPEFEQLAALSALVLARWRGLADWV